MADTVIDEKALQADIDEARRKITDTRALYKWVCALLFFRYGITPTTNRLYQLVRKGSMGTVTTALSTFWQDLRERSRIQIDHPGVPDSLKSAAGELVHALWEKANVEAKAQFDAAMTESSAKVAAAESAADEAHKIIEALRSESSILGKRIEAMTDEKATLAGTYEDERRAHSATSASLAAARADAATLRQDLADARRDFAAELDKAREAVRLSQERLDAAERRALLEIDRERTARAEADKVVLRLRTDLAASEKAASARIQTLAGENGELVGRLKAADAAQARSDQEATQLRSAASDWESKAARAEGTLTAVKDRVAELHRELDRDPIERAQDVTVAAMKDFAQFAEEWKLNDTEQLALLDTRDTKRMKSWAAGEQIMAPVSYQRVQQLREIYRHLDVWLTRSRGADWLRRSNDSEKFKGKSAMDLMLKGHLKDVRDFLAAATSGDFG
ncbi:MAG: DNA-binding protein [Betaproteobacteria bacterium]|nr:DNA-binding protein [Betaproteobacteria bacterium]